MTFPIPTFTICYDFVLWIALFFPIFLGSYFRFVKRVQVKRRNPTTATWTAYEHVSIFLVFMNPLKCSIGIGYSNHIYVFLFHGNLIFNLRRAPLYYILGSDDKDILKIDIIYSIHSKKKGWQKMLDIDNLANEAIYLSVFDELKGSLFPEGYSH